MYCARELIAFSEVQMQVVLYTGAVDASCSSVGVRNYFSDCGDQNSSLVIEANSAKVSTGTLAFTSDDAGRHIAYLVMIHLVMPAFLLT